MNKIILCLILTMLFSAGVLGQRSVRSKTTKQLTPQQSWKTFFPKFKAAVESQDISALRKALLLTDLLCIEWEVCKSINKVTPDSIFRELGKNNNRGWKNFKNFLDEAKDTTSVTSEEITYGKSIALSSIECDVSVLWFKFKNGRWFFQGFSIAGCH